MAEVKADAVPARSARVPWITLVLSVLVVVTALGVIYTAHRSRELFRTLEQ